MGMLTIANLLLFVVVVQRIRAEYKLSPRKGKILDIQTINYL